MSEETWQHTELWTGIIAELPSIELELTDPIARTGAGARASITITADAKGLQAPVSRSFTYQAATLVVLVKCYCPTRLIGNRNVDPA